MDNKGMVLAVRAIKEEIRSRMTSLRHLDEEINRFLRDGVLRDEFYTKYQANMLDLLEMYADAYQLHLSVVVFAYDQELEKETLKSWSTV